MEKINALIEKLQELKNSNAGLQTISYYVQLLQAEVLHTRNAQLQQKNTQTNIAVIMPSDRMAAHNTLPPAEQVQAPVAQATSAVPAAAEYVPAPAPVAVPAAAAPAPATPENIPVPAAAAPRPAPREENIPAAPAQSSPAAPAPPPANHPPKEEAKPVILHIPKLVAAYTPPVVKHPPPPAPEAPVHTVPAPAAATPAPTPAHVPPTEHVPAATYTPPAAATPAAAPAQVPPTEYAPAANHTLPPVPPVTPSAPPAEVPAVAATAKPVPPVPKPAPATLFDTTSTPAPAHHNGHRQEQHTENHSIRKELNELVGQSQSGTSLNERLKTANVEVAEKLREMGVKDLRDAIGINDKFQFIQELFRGDRDMYDRSVKTINECTSLQEAEYWIQRELKIYQGWQDEDILVKHFYSLVKKRFS